MSSIGSVMVSSPSQISIKVSSLETFENNKKNLQVGKYLKIEDGNHNYAIAIIKNIAAKNDDNEWEFTIDATPVGALIPNEISEGFRFLKGTPVLPVPTEPAFIMEASLLETLFTDVSGYNFNIGKLSNNTEVDFNLHGDKFFSKHIGVVGSTGSGKSCAVSHILQKVVGINSSGYSLHGSQNNSHVVIFDLHSEYAAAFNIEGKRSFTLNNLSVDELQLPYWLMNSEELESMFIESNESNSHNQIAIFKRAVIANKKRHNPGLNDVNYDTPCYFSISEVVNYIDNFDREVIGKAEGEGKPKLIDGTLIDNPDTIYFESRLSFAPTSTAKAEKASNGPFNGEFNRFISRLETRLSDDRLKFLLKPIKSDGSTFKSDDFLDLLKQFIGYSNKSNVTIFDVSGVPFEVLSVTISLLSRIIFDFSFHNSKLCHVDGEANNIPILLVCEEAHNYVPASESSMYKASRKSIERIAKEGRKYGLSLMVVSQRPSEVSPTIFSQCNNFIALRLTNKADQNYIKGLLPENTNAAAEMLPSLGQGEALVVGDATLMPSLVQMPKPIPEPKSASVDVHSTWNQSWLEARFADVIKRWRKDSSEDEQGS
ncbi:MULTISPECIES: ATP-binding protein [Vibrio]|uniref:ATP-binding protein n=1 Tax=Vibrio TaxID=662 RepID=UPI00187E5652|nr:ATP-binding protein [Vibrio sp. OPT46]ELK2077788.1 ATP-binding protein [Vibrio alginolyticus]MBE8570592.1 ATP-binding protein [Vibrio sp. OPT46]